MHTGDFAYLAIQLTSNGQIYSRTMFKCDELKNIFSIKYSLELYFLYQSNKKLSQLINISKSLLSKSSLAVLQKIFHKKFDSCLLCYMYFPIKIKCLL